MKYRVLAALILLALAPRVDAETLKIFTDEALTATSIDDNTPGIVSFYVVHSGYVGATGVRFSAKPSPGFTGVWLSDASSFYLVGTSPIDISIGYGVCDISPLLILTMSYQMFGTSSPCSDLRIAPANGFPCVIGSDLGCFFAESCIQDLGSIHVNCPVAVEPATWGRVKALYRN